MILQPIAHMRSDFSAKFGVPRQSGLAPHLGGLVVFTPPYRDTNALRGLEAFSHIWLIWGFDDVSGRDFAPTVRPPRLGGNRRLGVFATRTPNRPNPLGLSAVALDGIAMDADLAPVLRVRGADLVDGTAIYDVKPYLPYADCLPDALGGFADSAPDPLLRVEAPEAILAVLTAEQRAALLEVLALDPRPAYQADPGRVYGFPFARFEVKFRVAGDILTVLDICPT